MLGTGLLFAVDAQAEGRNDRMVEPHLFSVPDATNYKVSKPFSDVPATSNYYDAVHILRDLGIVNGYDAKQFKPQQSITRKQAALLISRLVDKQYITLTDVREAASFKDLGWQDYEAYQAVNALYRAGLLNPDTKGNISPNAPLTRGEMAKILVVAFDIAPAAKTNSFTDIKNKETAGYASALLEKGITTGYGDGTFKPQTSLSRAHYAQFIFRTLQHKTAGYVSAVASVGNENMSSNYQERWAPTILTFMTAPDANTYATVDVKTIKEVESNIGTWTETIPAQVTVQTYSRDYQLLATKTLPKELPLFGTFYEGKDYYYIAYGQENAEQNNNKEVIRIVKYDRDFKRVGALSVKGGDIGTINPFRSTASRMAEQDGQLVLHTARLRYTSEDGLNHQSQLTLVIDTNTMRVVNDTSLFQKNHVSHSFNQFVLFDGANHVLLDHGDAYPRSLVLHKGNGSSYQEKDIVTIPGPIGANQTGVSIGGFEQTNTHYVVLYNEIDHRQAKQYDSFDIQGVNVNQRAIKIAAVSKDLSSVQTKELISYTNTPKKQASVPTLVKTGEDEFVVLWQEFTAVKGNTFAPTALKYVKVNGNGEKLSAIQSKEDMYLAYMQPVYANGTISWFVNQDGEKFFYALDVGDL